MNTGEPVLREPVLSPLSHSNPTPSHDQQVTSSDNIGDFDLTGPLNLIVRMELEPLSSPLRHPSPSDIPGVRTSLGKRLALDFNDGAPLLKTSF